MKTHLLNIASPPQGPLRQLSEYLTKGRYQRKKRDYVGKIPKRRTPPPVWETPVIKKKLGLFFILGPQEIFGLHQKITILGDRLKLCCGNR